MHGDTPFHLPLPPAQQGSGHPPAGQFSTPVLLAPGFPVAPSHFNRPCPQHLPEKATPPEAGHTCPPQTLMSPLSLLPDVPRGVYVPGLLLPSPKQARAHKAKAPLSHRRACTSWCSVFVMNTGFQDVGLSAWAWLGCWCCVLWLLCPRQVGSLMLEAQRG